MLSTPETVIEASYELGSNVNIPSAGDTVYLELSPSEVTVKPIEKPLEFVPEASTPRITGIETELGSVIVTVASLTSCANGAERLPSLQFFLT